MIVGMRTSQPRISSQARIFRGRKTDPRRIERTVPTHTAGRDARPAEGCAGIAEVAGQLLQMSEASLAGYRELLDAAPERTVRDFAAVMIQQRAAQCRELAERFGVDASEVDVASEELRLLWIRAVWNFEQDRAALGFDLIAEAEEQLEDAFLQAAALYPDCSSAVLFQEQATNICGARERLDARLATETSL